MPKIIHDLNKRIEQSAIELFNAYDYNQVDMKMIAKKCHIAVGTLYNYYPNKKQLFIHVLECSWSETSHTLDRIYAMDLTPEEKLSQSIEVLYDDIAHRKGMGKLIYKVLARQMVEEAEMIDLFHTIFFQLERLFESFEKKSFSCSTETLDIRLAKSLITQIQNAIASYPHEREDNLHFIQDFFYNSMHVDTTLKKVYLKDHAM
ncbi:TetR/AcrR family transcriptional regulator [Niameybacter massiliensis]|uniref:TetR/AcrR family transcriptional regulator n=1 Tax=Holtiella tumoricola TaxID=3018743 RepID=A0AA42DRP0_9FIRM|nr:MULTISPECIES: TetR/AcrR family transcriptional regulator [Lachnospirales]MDA3733826.1 TetR/AcrR family transcriptional regulator [Holtiella tumoricola]